MNTVIKRNGQPTSLILDKMRKVAEFACEGLESEGYTADRLVKEVQIQLKDGMTTRQIQQTLIRTAVELTSVAEPKWQFVASKLLAYDMYKEAGINRGYAGFGYGDFYSLMVDLTERGLYGEYMLDGYTKEEIDELGAYIKPERDYLMNYNGLKLLLDRYVIRALENKEVLELAQEMYMGISMHLALVEKTPADKIKWAKHYYDMSSTLRMTFATPTMSNARKTHHQLSSCFIDTVPDNLTGIYRTDANFAEVSKQGGGMGIYYGHVRARKSDIRGHKDVSRGVIPWIKQNNNTAIAVDQLGTRSGSVAIYLDIWHRDLMKFLVVRTNSGDDREKAHDVFPGLCIPNLFWELAAEDMENEWNLFCPHEILKTMGYRLEDYTGEEWKTRYYACVANPSLKREVVSVKDIVSIMLTSVIETGTPFVFNRDNVNEMNPNAHAGMIRCSNLCTEILQNQSAAETISNVWTDEDGTDYIDTRQTAGDFVVCNLSSVVVSRNLEYEQLRESVRTQMRAMDAVIDLNEYPIPNAEITNKKYRAVGLGSQGYQHALALLGIKWESEEHIEWAEDYYAHLAYYAIEASVDLAKERGAYKVCKGSDWQTGAYFSKRGLEGTMFGLDWDYLREQCAIHGVRNAWMMAGAPNGSTSISAGTTATVDPLVSKFFMEEKKGATFPQVAPDLNADTIWYYKEAHRIDQMYSIRANAVRSRFIDQGQSFNLYIDPEEITMRTVFNYYYEAWRLGIKTIYYVRSKSLEIEECVSCSA